MRSDPLTPDVLAMLGAATGIASKEAWTNIWFLISKTEQGNDDIHKTWLTDKGTSLFTYASALSYDRHKRGVTIGCVGWTTANDGKDGHGDAPALFAQYKALGGVDLAPYVKGCCASQDACKKLIAKIKTLDDDPTWAQAQFKNLVTGDGYLKKTMDAWKKVGIAKPSALAVGVVFDTSLNQGFDGPDGGCTHLVKLAVKGNEAATLEKYCAWKTKVAGTSEYNDPKINGTNRGKMWAALVDAKCFSLVGCDKDIAKVTRWELK